MSIFSQIDIVISDSVASGDTSSKIVETLIRDYRIDQKYAQEMIDQYMLDYQNDFESKFEIYD